MSMKKTVDYEAEFKRYELMAANMCTGKLCNVGSTPITLYARLGMLSLMGMKTGITPKEALAQLRKFETSAKNIARSLGEMHWFEDKAPIRTKIVGNKT